MRFDLSFDNELRLIINGLCVCVLVEVGEMHWDDKLREAAFGWTLGSGQEEKRYIRKGNLHLPWHWISGRLKRLGV